MIAVRRMRATARGCCKRAAKLLLFGSCFVVFRRTTGCAKRKLLVSSLSLVRSRPAKEEFDPLHVALEIGNLMIEWEMPGVVRIRHVSRWPWKEVQLFFVCHVHLFFAVHCLRAEITRRHRSDRGAPSDVVRCRRPLQHDQEVCDSGHDPRADSVNSHAFVAAVLNRLGVVQWWTDDDCVGEYIDDVISEPAVKLRMAAVGPFLPQQEFQSHEDLDEFVRQKRKEGLKEDSPEYRLLKSWDRAFWIRQVWLFFWFTCSVCVIAGVLCP